MPTVQKRFYNLDTLGVAAKAAAPFQASLRSVLRTGFATLQAANAFFVHLLITLFFLIRFQSLQYLVNWTLAHRAIFRLTEIH